jgi:hypothetical protein
MKAQHKISPDEMGLRYIYININIYETINTPNEGILKQSITHAG